MTTKPYWLTCSLAALALALSLGTASADSLWRDQGSRSMFADRKAVGVGDIITILVQETSIATKDNTTSTAKKSGIDASLTTFLYSPAASGLMTHNGKLPALKADTQHDFTGGGTINNSEKIVAKIAARVTDVLPNQQVVVEALRQTSFGGESQELSLHGVVRLDDIGANNIVYSYTVADATIKITSHGSIPATQRKGWFTRVWEFVTPF
jgi:flagellar L-ring protein FlgH